MCGISHYHAALGSSQRVPLRRKEANLSILVDPILRQYGSCIHLGRFRGCADDIPTSAPLCNGEKEQLREPVIDTKTAAGGDAQRVQIAQNAIIPNSVPKGFVAYEDTEGQLSQPRRSGSATATCTASALSADRGSADTKSDSFRLPSGNFFQR